MVYDNFICINNADLWFFIALSVVNKIGFLFLIHVITNTQEGFFCALTIIYIFY